MSINLIYIVIYTWGTSPDRQAAYHSPVIPAFQHYRFIIYTANEFRVLAGYLMFNVDDRMLDCLDQMVQNIPGR